MFNRTIATSRRIAIAALPLAVATSLVTTGTAAADVVDQSKIAAGLSSTGVDNGVGFKTSVSPDLRLISASVDNGTFVIEPNATKARVISAAGATVAEVPLAVPTVGGNTISFAAVVADDAKSIQLAPVFSADTEAELKNIATNPDAANHDPVPNGAAAGATFGVILAAIICLPSLAAFIVGYLACLPVLGLSAGLWWAMIGAFVGLVRPDLVPQVLP
ncbi:hypothetical protein [Nocardia camponoti]|uniref:DUF8020 domain-containing protein n=1 Tax=Nocardia camponoti TaxID=1616106 RepID=A0A917QML4_9NOCA|nr:hypothetical protein [Nocardia camponoti]GGK58435.1 hypothetical protein GCM10011591_33280 [Nocardia camponoti]